MHLPCSAPTGMSSGAVATEACLLHMVFSSHHNIFHCARYEKIIHRQCHIVIPCIMLSSDASTVVDHCLSLCQCSGSAVYRSDLSHPHWPLPQYVVPTLRWCTELRAPSDTTLPCVTSA